MKALIIAAGNGTRMQSVTRGRHKSLMSLLGLRIIERIILAAKEAGIFEFVIVTGYKGEELKESVGDGSRFGVSITYVQNNKWEKANGISVFEARDYFKENFILLMSDHVFDWRTLVKLKRIKLKKDECALVIDKNLDSVLDIDDTTKVLVKNNKITSINKNLDVYNAYDTGMFFCSPYIFKVLKKTISDHKNSLTNGMRVIAKEGKLRAFNIKGRFWSDCDTYADIKLAENKLLKRLTKPADGFLSKKINRKVSTFLTRFLIKTPITPNIISFTIPVIGILTFFILAKGIYPWTLIGGLLIQFISIIDGCDGELARIKFLGSKWGGFLDASLDKYVDTAIVAGMALGYLKITGNEIILPMALLIMLGLGLDGYMPNKFAVSVGKKLSLVNFFKSINMKRDIRLLVLALGAIFNQVFLAFVVIILIYHFKVVIRLISARRICKEIDSRSGALATEGMPKITLSVTKKP